VKPYFDLIPVDEEAWKNDTAFCCNYPTAQMYGIETSWVDSLRVLNFIRQLNSPPCERWPLPRILEWHLQDQTEESMHYYRCDALKTLGISKMETARQDIFGPLDDLKASNLLRGPFSIQTTNNPAEHLTFKGPHSHSTLRLFSIDSIFYFYRIHRSGIATSFKLKLSLTS
jgi:hypothetical protein